MGVQAAGRTVEYHAVTVRDWGRRDGQEIPVGSRGAPASRDASPSHCSRRTSCGPVVAASATLALLVCCLAAIVDVTAWQGEARARLPARAAERPRSRPAPTSRFSPPTVFLRSLVQDDPDPAQSVCPRGIAISYTAFDRLDQPGDVFPDQQMVRCYGLAAPTRPCPCRRQRHQRLSPRRMTASPPSHRHPAPPWTAVRERRPDGLQGRQHHATCPVLGAHVDLHGESLGRRR